MMVVDNIYYNIGEEYNVEQFKKEILYEYKTKERIRLIFDLDGKNISMGPMKKLKKVFEEIGVEKLEETCILVDKKGFKLTLIKQFLKLVKTERPVKFV